MAVNGFTSHPSSTERQKLFSRHLIGESTFGLERTNNRPRLFLQRNLSRNLTRHEKRLHAVLKPVQDASLTVGTIENASSGADPTAAALNELTSGGATAHDAGATAHSTAPAGESNMATTSLPQPEAQRRERNRRRSERFKEILCKVHDHIDAELTLDICSIRKKLNFKTNSINESERPAKRQKRDTVRCLCHLTIWDNRDGSAAIPLITKSSYCRVTGIDNGVHGHFVDLELEEPFVVKATEIKVPVTTGRASAFEVIDKYFLEIKIIPCRADSRWPPVKLLGISDGDHFAPDIGKTGSEELQGAIVARYTHLPTAPDGDVPLSVFFLHEGRTYRTKYGLQVVSTWQRAGAGKTKQENKGLDLNSFRQPVNGVQIPNGTTQSQESSKPAQLKIPSRPDVQAQPEVCYSFPGNGSDCSDEAQEFRDAILQGYRCPFCAGSAFDKLQSLQFHLTRTHWKFKWSILKPRRNYITHELSQVHIKVELPRNTLGKKDEDEGKLLDWTVPRKPFDLSAFADGDDSWVTGKPPAPKSTKAQTSSSPNRTKSTRDRPLAKDVREFRLPERKKWKAITLETKYAADDPELVYTSISHRPVSPTEDARSETDDEIDNEWQIATHMERLGLIAAKENWSPYKRELTKRWDRHRMEEHLEHSHYLSNSLIRFVRKQRDWLRSSGDDELLQCFFEFLARLKERKAIDDNVIADVNEMIFQDSSPQEQIDARRGTSVNTKARPTAPKPATIRTPQAEQQPTNVTNICLLCNKPVKYRHNSVTFCMDPSCTTPTQRYHKKCAVVSPRTRKGKEKATTLPYPPQDEELRLKMWSCNGCKARQKDRVHAAEMEKEGRRRRERELVEDRARRALGTMA